LIENLALLLFITGIKVVVLFILVRKFPEYRFFLVRMIILFAVQALGGGSNILAKGFNDGKMPAIENPFTPAVSLTPKKDSQEVVYSEKWSNLNEKGKFGENTRLKILCDVIPIRYHFELNTDFIDIKSNSVEILSIGDILMDLSQYYIIILFLLSVRFALKNPG
jgi:hypothetical protein